jgi:gamma-glutamyl:cysteine ligase YbdK (ATP-grasp superfamily)
MSNKEKKGNHKSMEGRVLRPGAFERFLALNNLEVAFSPDTQGGLITDKHGKHIAYVRSPYWRAEQGAPSLTRADIRPLHVYENPSLDHPNIQTGSEFEMYVWNPTSQDMAPIMSPSSPVPQTLIDLNGQGGFVFENDVLFQNLHPNKRKVGFSAELATGCMELNMPPSSNGVEAGLSLLGSMKTLSSVVDKQGWQLTPLASFPHRPIQKEDTHPHPYIQRIALDYMGWENGRHFTGSSFQVHVEMLSLEAALPAINLYQQISPLLYALSLSGPFINGETNPNLAAIYLEDETDPERQQDTNTYNALKHNNWHSVRYPSRWRGSPSGGVFQEPLPEQRHQFFSMVEAMLENDNPKSKQNIPNPGRAAGQHRDRIRVDIPPYGTLEISNMDTAGGNINKLIVIQELTKALIWKLQIYATAGKLQELCQQYPRLFYYPVSVKSLRNAHFASIEVAKNGLEANIPCPNGETVKADILLEELITFVNEPLIDAGLKIEYYGLPPEITKELQLSSSVPTSTDYELYRDDLGIVDLYGYYQTGIGTLSYWLKERAQNLVNLGFSSEEAIKNCMDNLGAAFHKHLVQTTGTTIAQLFDLPSPRGF